MKEEIKLTTADVYTNISIGYILVALTQITVWLNGIA